MTQRTADVSGDVKTLRRDVRRALEIQQTGKAEIKVLLGSAERIFGDLETFELFRTCLEQLFEHDGVPVRPSRDHFDIYPVEVLTVLTWVKPERQALPYAPYLAAAYISYTEAREERISPDEWRALFRDLQEVPMEYLTVVLDGSDEVFPHTLTAVGDWRRQGLEAQYAAALTLQSKVLPDLGYTLDEALRLQAAGVEPLFANLVYYQAKGSAVETALTLSKAGVPYGYAHAMLQAGIPCATIAEMHLFEVPLEYALMMANVGRMDG